MCMLKLLGVLVILFAGYYIIGNALNWGSVDVEEDDDLEQFNVGFELLFWQRCKPNDN